jgi:hypothetical protein
MTELKKNHYGKLLIIPALFRLIRSRIAALFEPEEVEVNWKTDGNRTVYTFTRIAHKQVA